VARVCVRAPAFEKQNQIHYSGLDGRPRDRLLLLAAVSLEEIAATLLAG